MKHLIRVCCNSEAYALSAEPNASNRDDHQNFARYYPRRLQAEVLLDAFSQALGVPTDFPGGPGKFPPGTRAIDLPDEAVPNAFLDVFGRPARASSCECERVGEPSLGQALALIGSPILEQKLTAKDGCVPGLASRHAAARGGRRRPVRARLSAARAARRGREGPAVPRSRSPIVAPRSSRSLWSLLVSAEFLFNH